MEGIIYLLLVVAVIVVIIKGLKVVPQGEEWVVERMGRFDCVLEPGLNLIIPIVDSVRYKITTKDIILDIPQQEVITKDNAVILANAIAFIKVTNVQRAVYGIENFSLAMQNMIQTSLRSIVGGLMLNEALSSREKIKAQLKQAISDEAADWGLTVKSVEIQDIRPSENMQKSMEKQASAERERVAMITKAEAEKSSTILNAEAQLEATKKDAEAKIINAEATAKSIEIISNMLKENPAGSTFILGEQYIKGLQDLSKSNNAKMIVLPSDIVNTIKSLTGTKI